MTLRPFSLFALIFISTLIPSSAQSDSSRFLDHGNGTVSDKHTGLMWQKGDSFLELKKGLNWYQALEYADRKNREKFAGHNDWRLPSMKELDGIWDAQQPNRSKDGEPIGLPPLFNGGGSYYLWSGDERSLDNVWYFGLGQKEHYFNLKEIGDLEQGVKLVRKEK